MASTNLTYSGSDRVLEANAYVTEITTTGKSRTINLVLTIKAIDYSGARDGYYSVSCNETSTSIDRESCTITGNESEIFNEEFTVTVGSDNTTANINLSFTATVKSPSAGNKTITGTITQLTLTEIIPEYKLNILEDIGSSIEVIRTVCKSYPALTGLMFDGDEIYNGDVLKITFKSLNGYDLKTHTVNGSTFASGQTYTVSNAGVTVKSTSTPKSYTLSINQGIGSSISVDRESSLVGSKGILKNGETIYYSDRLRISFSANNGYNIVEHAVNGTTFSSGNIYSVTGNVAIISTASVKAYKLTLNPGIGSTITVNRTSSPLKNAATGNISNGASIYYSDVLKISFTTSSGYTIESKLVNQQNFTSGSLYTVNGDVEAVTITSKISGAAHIYNNGSYATYLIYIHNGKTWDQYIPYVHDGTGWKICC